MLQSVKDEGLEETKDQEEIIKLRAVQCTLALEVESLKDQLKAAQNKGNQITIVCQELETQLEMTENKLLLESQTQTRSNQLEEEITDLLEKIKFIEQKLVHKEEAYDHLENSLSESAAQNTAQTNVIEFLKQSLEETTNRNEDQELSNERLRTTLDSLEQERSQLQLDNSRLTEERSELQSIVAESKHGIENMETQIDDISKECSKNRSKATELEQVNTNLISEQAKLRSKQSEMHIECLAAAAKRKVHEHEANQMQDELHSLHDSQAHLKAALDELKTKHDLTVSEKRLMEGQVALCENEIERMKQLINNLNAENSDLVGSNSQKSGTLAELEEEVKSKNQEIHNLQNLVRDLEASHNNEELIQDAKSNEILALQDRLDSIVREKVMLEAERLEAVSIADQVRRQISQSDALQADLNAEKMRNTSNIVTLESQLATSASEIENLQSEVQILQTQAMEANTKTERMECDLEKTRIETDKLQRQLSEKEEQCKSLHFEGKPALAVLKQQRASSSIRARVRRSLEVSESLAISAVSADATSLSQTTASQDSSTHTPPPTRSVFICRTSSYWLWFLLCLSFLPVSVLRLLLQLCLGSSHKSELDQPTVGNIVCLTLWYTATWSNETP